MIERILLASNSFKEHLTSLEVNEYLKLGIMASGFEGSCTVLPISDGGNETITVLEKLKDIEKYKLRVAGPEKEPIEAEYITFRENGNLTAFIEYSGAAGIKLSKNRKALEATSYGVGQIINDALERGSKTILIGLGDSATTDCGMGLLQALGVDFFDFRGKLIDRNESIAIRDITKIDATIAQERLQRSEAQIICLCDGTQAMGGYDGSWMRAKQKGATNLEVAKLKDGVNNFINVVREITAVDLENMPFTGCAGGVSGGLHALLGAKLISGSEAILNLLDFDNVMKPHDLVITGEGIIDLTTFTGKAPHAVAQRARRHNKPVIAIASQIKCSTSILSENGIDFALRTELQNYDFREIKEKQLGPKLLGETGLLLGALIRILTYNSK